MPPAPTACAGHRPRHAPQPPHAIEPASAVTVEAPAELAPLSPPLPSGDEAAPPPLPARPPPPPPVDTVRVLRLTPVASVADALVALRAAVDETATSFAPYTSATLRLETLLPAGGDSALWLAGQPDDVASLLPRFFFSPRRGGAPATPGGDAAAASSGGRAAFAGVGAARAWTAPAGPGAPTLGDALDDASAFLSEAAPSVRAVAAGRFDDGTSRAPSPGWSPFGAHLVLLPALEYSEGPACDKLAVTLAWRPGPGGAQTVAEAAATARAALAAARPPAPAATPTPATTMSPATHVPDEAGWRAALAPVAAELTASASTPRGAPPPPPLSVDVATARDEYEANGQAGLEALLAELDGVVQRRGSGGGGVDDDDSPSSTTPPLTKAVLARRTDVTFTGGPPPDPLALVAAMAASEPRAYQFLIDWGRAGASVSPTSITTAPLTPALGCGAAFLGSSPEQLYARTGAAVASEAVAGTRPRGAPADAASDFWLAYDLLRSPKDHAEFSIVRDWVAGALARVCVPASVAVDRGKSVLKQGGVQHLHARLSGALVPSARDAHVLAALHPTPAVCGRPRRAAADLLAAVEPFDRGLYAGPCGWVSGRGAEFCVAIRSARLDRPPADSSSSSSTAHIYAGVGVVAASDAGAEWRELDLKASLLASRLTPRPPLTAAPNPNAAAAAAILDELARLGVPCVCVAPGARSSPLALAAARHASLPLVRALDERSLAFYALGVAKATRRPAAVITTSGTAVANLVPAAVEAGMSGTPLLLLTADRPAELRGTGANQTIHQPGLFGVYARFEADVPPPCGGAPLTSVLGVVGEAVARSVGPRPGAVHVNLQFREPLGTLPAPLPAGLLAGLGAWHASGVPLTQRFGGGGGSALTLPPALAAAAATARCPLLVLGEARSPGDAAAAARLASSLGWPTIADVLSGARVGAASLPPTTLRAPDSTLAGGAGSPVWTALAPDFILQVGARLTSKRVVSFLAWAASTDGGSATWALVDADPSRLEPAPGAITLRLEADVAAAASALLVLPRDERAVAATARYAALAATIDAGASARVLATLAAADALTEPAAARAVATGLPPGHALFVGNSMPIRDVDMFSSVGVGGGEAESAAATLSFPRVAACRGASGIDGVLSAAAGFAAGARRPTTLLIGDLSFLHDSAGLALLASGEARPPVTVVIFNNAGGGIFSLVPDIAAGPLADGELDAVWATPQPADLASLCRAHGVPHQAVKDGAGLTAALAAARGLGASSVVEVVLPARADNAALHGALARAGADGAAAALALAAGLGGGDAAFGAAGGAIVTGIDVSRVDVPLVAQPTTTAADAASTTRSLLRVTLHARAPDGRALIGVGEAAPLPGLLAESLADAAAALSVAARALAGTRLPLAAPCLGGALRAWVDAGLGADSATMLPPSARCGLEVAALAALADGCGHPLALTLGAPDAGAAVPSAGLVDGVGSPADAAAQAAALVAAGVTTLKLKVGRRESPAADAAAVCAVRAAVGPSIRLRADANRAWSLADALIFDGGVAGARLDYVEEPLADVEVDGACYVETATTPIALDESVDAALRGAYDGGEAVTNALAPLLALRPAAIALKPSVLGGADAVAAAARAATAARARVVVSSSFESSHGLTACAALAAALSDGEPAGLGTERWFVGGRVRASIDARGAGRPPVGDKPAVDMLPPSPVDDILTVAIAACGSVTLRTRTTRGGAAIPPSPGTILLLHGWLGTADDWDEVAAGLTAATGTACVAIDLPWHGATVVDESVPNDADGGAWTTAVAAITAAATTLPAPVHLVGYSLGARLAAAVAATTPVARVALVSGGGGHASRPPRGLRARAGTRPWPPRWWGGARPPSLTTGTRARCGGRSERAPGLGARLPRAPRPRPAASGRWPLRWRGCRLVWRRRRRW